MPTATGRGTRAHEPEVSPGRRRSPEVERLAVVGKERAGLTLGEAVANERLCLGVVGLEERDAGVHDESVRWSGRPGLEQLVRIGGRRPRWQRKQPIAIHARLCDEVG